MLHERLEPLPWDTTEAHGFFVRSGREGGRNNNPQKYRDDAATLESALLTETDPFLVSRYTFYLAQSYRDCGEREKALANYLKRAPQGFWTEEIFYSLYQAGMLQELLGFPTEEVLPTLRARATPRRFGQRRCTRLPGTVARSETTKKATNTPNAVPR